MSNRPALTYLAGRYLAASVLQTKPLATSNYQAARYLASLTSIPRDNLGLSPRPIFSLTKSSRGLANTTSGTFAPSTVGVDHAHAQSVNFKSSSTHNLSILDDSDHLPSLPVPNLSETLERLKETIWPITMNSAEFAHALDLIEAFAGSAGQKLDLLLRAKASQTKNWLTHDWWTQEAYLKSQAPLVINSNPAMIYPEFPFEVDNQRRLISTMAQLVSGVIDFKLALLQGYNPEALAGQDEFRLSSNLCYNQYKYIFGSTRMPDEHMDSVKLKMLEEDNKYNLILSHKGHFFEIQLNNIDNEKERIETLQSVFSKIIDCCSTNELISTSGVGVLTADRRDRWAQSIKLLDSESVRAIREAHLMVCLDSISSQSDDEFASSLLDSDQASERHKEALSRQVLHADRTNLGNRWFDKSLQLIVVADEDNQRLLGAGINYEHSVAEAMVVTKLIEYSFDKTVQQKNLADQQVSSSQVSDSLARDSSTSARYRHLKLVGAYESSQLEVECLITQIKRDFVAQLNQFDLTYFNYKHYGSNSIKSWRFSPDSWFQVGLQLAYFQLHKRLGPCYESASTRHFAYGRTETIRSLTKDVAEFCQEPTFSTMQAAIRSHKSYANAANNAAAIDRVLLAYRLIFNELKANQWAWGLPTFDSNSSTATEQTTRLRFHSLEDADSKQQVDLNDLFTEDELNTLAAFFNNELIERSKKFALSTSQVSSVHPGICMSYGPLLADGYGCCYNISGQQMVAAITANSSNQSFSCEVNKFSESLSESLDKMRDIVESNQQQQRSNVTH